MNELIPLYREMAAGGDQFFGLSILQHTKQIKSIIKEQHINSVLDYGCGRGDAYASPFKVWHEWGLRRSDVTLYDPSFKGRDVLPSRQFDLVLCSDVLEHVPEYEVAEFVATLFNHAKCFVWASVCCRPAKKTFPTTGENLHVTQRPLQWWQDTFEEIGASFPNVKFALVETP